MAFNTSAMFRAFVQYNLLRDNGVTLQNYEGLEADALKVALFNDDVVPDKDAAMTSTGFNTGTWVTADQVTDTDGSSDWPSGGVALAGGAYTTGTNFAGFDATDTTHSNTVTISGAFGCLVYDDDTTTAGSHIADQGVTYHAFGGSQSVTTGTFTVVWHANGLFRITV